MVLFKYEIRTKKIMSNTIMILLKLFFSFSISVYCSTFELLSLLEK